MPTNLHLTKASDCPGAAERLEQGASWQRWAQALTVPAHILSTTSVDGSPTHCAAAAIESFLLRCLPMDGS